MVHGVHIFTLNITMIPFTTDLSGVERESRERDSEGDLTNVQYKPVQNCHNESPLYNKHILIIIMVIS
jgi:hypothetical protein